MKLRVEIVVKPDPHDDGRWIAEAPGVSCIATGASRDEALRRIRVLVADTVRDRIPLLWVEFVDVAAEALAELNRELEDLDLP